MEYLMFCLRLEECACDGEADGSRTGDFYFPASYIVALVLW